MEFNQTLSRITTSGDTSADTFNSALETGFDDITNILERSFLPIRWSEHNF
jgi:hypothetical protein